MNSYFDTVYDRVALNDELDAAQVNEVIATIARATNGWPMLVFVGIEPDRNILNATPGSHSQLDDSDITNPESRYLIHWLNKLEEYGLIKIVPIISGDWQPITYIAKQPEMVGNRMIWLDVSDYVTQPLPGQLASTLEPQKAHMLAIHIGTMFDVSYHAWRSIKRYLSFPHLYPDGQTTYVEAI